MKILTRFLFAFAFGVAGLLATAHQASADEPSIAYKIASLDTDDTSLNKESVVVMRYQKYLSLLSERFELPETTIADQTWAVRKILHEKDLKTTALDLMKGVAKIENPKEMGVDYASAVSMLATVIISQAVEE